MDLLFHNMNHFDIFMVLINVLIMLFFGHIFFCYMLEILHLQDFLSNHLIESTISRIYN